VKKLVHDFEANIVAAVYVWQEAKEILFKELDLSGNGQ
jgi:hypothetical protein